MAYRSFYALPPLNAPDGTPTNAITGFFNMMLKISKEWDVSQIVVLFDAKGPTFRHEAYEDYKKGRKPTPEDFKIQLPILERMLRAFGSVVAAKEGVEADDVIASTALHYAPKGRSVLTLSSDKDLMQILSDGIKIVRPQKGISNFKTYDTAAFVEEYGFQPGYMADYLALLGDKVDNIPGVPGVGKKTAGELISRYETLEEIEKNIDNLKGSLQKKLRENIQQAYESRELIYLKKDVFLPEDEMKSIDPDVDLFKEICEELGLQQILERTCQFWGVEVENCEQETTEIGEQAVASQPENFNSTTPDKFLKYDELACITNETEILLMSRDTDYWRGSLDVETLPKEILQCLGKKKIVTADYKALKNILGSYAPSPDNVWDYVTVHYLLHPDIASHDFKGQLDNESGKSMEITAFELLGEKEVLQKKLEETQMVKLMEDIELPLIPVLVEMERYGIGVKLKRFEQLGEELNSRLNDIIFQIEDETGTAINLNSPKQVAWLLFEHLKLPAKKKTKTGYSTNVQVLEELASLPGPDGKVPGLMLEHRELSKMISGFVVPIINLINKDTCCIHSRFESATTGTGRLSSREPNMQNLPAYGTWSQKLKEGFVPHSEDRCFVGADYSQVELRVLAHLSNEERLIEAFAGGRDIHTETAAWVFNVEPDFVTQELRRHAKMINFGLLYGMSSFGLAQRLGIGRSEASKVIDRYFAALPGVREYMDRTYQEAKERGYTVTLYGRRRPLNEVSTINGRGGDALRRVAINSPIQGTAADITRKAMVDFSREFQSDKSVNLVLQVHDSLICECNIDSREEIEKTLCRIMENTVDLAVPLKVESKTGYTLADV